ncbi:MAG: hypothetical protein HY341_01410 [Candidatus Kerfeldbacteria bacterium]|nr:hypothetical protein [Candidatus Kerfeldbacteria bacterium]
METDWIEFTAQHIAVIPPVSGVYELGDSHRGIMFIGKSENLAKTLLELQDPLDICLRDAAFFRIALEADLFEGVRRLFQEYEDEHGGCLPRCNPVNYTRR